MPTKADLKRINRKREVKQRQGYEKCPECGFKIADPRRVRCPYCDLDFFPSGSTRAKRGSK